MEPREVVAIAPRMVARAGLLASLGLRPAEHPSGAGMWVPADPAGRTEVPGVWVAGNVTDLGAQVGAPAGTAVETYFRPRDRILRFFDGFSLVPPGLADVESWRQHGAAPTRLKIAGAVGRKP